MLLAPVFLRSRSTQVLCVHLTSQSQQMVWSSQISCLRCFQGKATSRAIVLSVSLCCVWMIVACTCWRTGSHAVTQWCDAYTMPLCRMFANRIQTLVSSVTWCDRQKLPTHTNFKQLLTQHLQLCSCLLKALHDIPSIRYTAEEIGLSYQDIEWFSRATMLRAVMLVCHLYAVLGCPSPRLDLDMLI